MADRQKEGQRERERKEEEESRCVSESSSEQFVRSVRVSGTACGVGVL